MIFIPYKNNMKVFIREYIISILLTILLIFILSVLISNTSMPEKIIKPATIGISSLSLMIGAFRISKSKKENGILNGCILGIVYMLTLYIMSGFLSLQFTLTISSIIMISIGILGGAIGGIIGVNF